MKFFPFINHFIVKPQGNELHRHKHIKYYVIRESTNAWLWPAERHKDKPHSCAYMYPTDYGKMFCMRAALFYICWIYCTTLFYVFSMCVPAGWHMPIFLCANMQPGYADFSLLLLFHSQSSLCRREISSISSFMWCGTAKEVRVGRGDWVTTDHTVCVTSGCLQRSRNCFFSVETCFSVRSLFMLGENKSVGWAVILFMSTQSYFCFGKLCLEVNLKPLYSTRRSRLNKMLRLYISAKTSFQNLKVWTHWIFLKRPPENIQSGLLPQNHVFFTRSRDRDISWLVCGD